MLLLDQHDLVVSKYEVINEKGSIVTFREKSTGRIFDLKRGE